MHRLRLTTGIELLATLAFFGYAYENRVDLLNAAGVAFNDAERFTPT